MSHVAIIGAGLIGSALALRLVDLGARVTLVDAGGPRASDASFGWINAAPGNAGEYLALRVAAMAAWRRWDGCAATCARWTGALTWEEPEPELVAHAAALAAHGIPARMVGAAEIARLAPALASPPPHALWCPDDGLVQAGAVAAEWRAAALAGGAVWRPGTAVAAEGGGVRLADGEITADHVVVAAGFGGAALAGLPLDHVPGLIAHTTPMPMLLDPLVAAPDLSFAQAPDGRIRAGEMRGGSDPGADPAQAAAEAIALLGAMLGRPVTLSHWTVGLRPMPRDGLPLIGRVGGVYVAAMHSGVTLAPLVAELIADEILTGAPASLLAAFRPGRAA